ncbi:3-methyl-2-oxobutanoate hydroxymethyltransferase, partial [Bilophila wadsworthia]
MVTAYDTPSARIVDRAGVDMVLVGDSLGMVMLGRKDTLSVTLDEMIHHCRAVVQGIHHALVVADMPFMTYEPGPDTALSNAARLVRESGVRAVKLEGAFLPQI